MGTKKQSDKLKKKTAELLRCINPKEPFGTDLFNAIARLTIGVAAEAVFLRKSEAGTTEVFMTLRGEGETYPGLWHCPGSFFRCG